MSKGVFMKLTVLVDNHTYIDQYYLGEPAVCYYIEDGTDKILFDLGYSNAFLKNAERLSIPLSALTKIVLSHGHNDHTGGFPYLADKMDLSRVTLVAHPNALRAKILEQNYISTNLAPAIASSNIRLSLSKKPVRISKNITFLGEIPTLFSFESRHAIGQQQSDAKEFEDDFLLDDSALVYRSPKGLFIITGCSHSGICNIVEYAKSVCHCSTIYGIIGGLHLFDIDERLAQTTLYLREQHLTNLYPCHCVSFQVKSAIHHDIPIQEVGVGLTLDL